MGRGCSPTTAPAIRAVRQVRDRRLARPPGEGLAGSPSGVAEREDNVVMALGASTCSGRNATGKPMCRITLGPRVALLHGLADAPSTGSATPSPREVEPLGDFTSRGVSSTNRSGPPSSRSFIAETMAKPFALRGVLLGGRRVPRLEGGLAVLLRFLVGRPECDGRGGGGGRVRRPDRVDEDSPAQPRPCEVLQPPLDFAWPRITFSIAIWRRPRANRRVNGSAAGRATSISSGRPSARFQTLIRPSLCAD